MQSRMSLGQLIKPCITIRLSDRLVVPCAEKMLNDEVVGCLLVGWSQVVDVFRLLGMESSLGADALTVGRQNETNMYILFF